MKFWRSYLLFVAAPVAGIALVLRTDRGILPGAPVPATVATPAAASHAPLAAVLLAIGVIVLATRVTGLLFRAIGQPQVIGEMAAGLLLGPSLLGRIAPGFSARLFPPEAFGPLNALSQIGLVLYLFVVGLELDLGHLKGRGPAALLTSHASIAAPFFLGILLARPLARMGAGPGVPFPDFALFLGAAMSVTAFPVLARILTDRNLQRTPLGGLALTCAAVDDATAWCILAGVVAVANAGRAASSLWSTVGGAAAFVLVLVFVARPLLAPFGKRFSDRRALSGDMLAIALLFAVASAWVSDRIGIHALFGAFLAGAVMPREPGLARAFARRLGDVSVVLLLPIFFALTGLRTKLPSFSAAFWGPAAIVLAAAVAGKLGGSSLAARAAGIPWRDAVGVGILMNTRGLMELVILNIGLDIGVISPALFAMMVLMAVVTTFMTTPLLSLLNPDRSSGVLTPSEGSVTLSRPSLEK